MKFFENRKEIMISRLKLLGWARIIYPNKSLTIQSFKKWNRIIDRISN